MLSTSHIKISRMNRVMYLRLMAIVLLTVGGRMEAQTIQLVWSGVNAGGGRSASSLTHVIACVGQPAVGTSVTGSFALKSGFLAAPILLGPVTGVPGDPTSNLPAEFMLEQNYPNPFNPSTTIRYQLPARSHVVLKVYDILGREIAALADELQDAGSRSVVLHAERLASGTYFYRLQANPVDGRKSGGIVVTKKLLLVR